MEEVAGLSTQGFVVVLATLAVVLVAAFIRAKATRKYKLPPGPRGWPVLGNLPMLGTLPHRTLFEMSKKYGPLMFLQLGSVKTIVVSSPKMSEEILKTHDQIMATRPKKIIPDVLFYNGNDMACVPCGPQWRRYRKICSTELLSAARLNQFQGIREQEILATVKFVQEESLLAKAVNVTKCLGVITTNNVTQMVMRKSYCFRKSDTSVSAEDHSKFDAIPSIFRDVLELSGVFNIADYIPMVKPFDLQGLAKRTKGVHTRLDKFLQDAIEDHLPAKTHGDSGDFVDVLLATGKDSSEEPLSMDAIKGLITDVLAGSIETTAVSSDWAFAEVLRHPHVMSKIQKELDSVVGPSRFVKETDIPELKYLQAVVKESARLHPSVPLLIPHESMADSVIGGYHIPVGTQVFVNIWANQRNPNVWERPSEFDPDRFLDSPIDLKGKNYELLPFGSGRRICPGLNMGLIMVQYSLAQLLHAFTWTLPEGQVPEDVDLSETFGASCHRTNPLKVFAKARLTSHVMESVLLGH